jgi:hypothetical protein
MKTYMGSGGKVLRICNLGNVRNTVGIGGRVGTRADLVAVEKRKISCLCRESNPNFSSAKPITSRYTD